ncbi:hypothetical protein [Terribacillus saccharophilus]|uniref:Uncharacterized protein n=1 Tax=Terribacillus saccharophilus TaxID=361277 RepID=A0A268AEV8_9BACI|nr:hypothetical protein [Terribacillus saccharophilus]PAD22649.1 hypothetical protein CHH64_02740 [Terribacillus saccharophilus]
MQDQTGVFDSILYGNNFSDLRDFAWLLSGFQDSFLNGKTYLAALLTFLPSSISEYRSEFSYARATLKFVGIDPDHRAGLRGGIFAKSYFNFGTIGVMLASIVIGFPLRYLDVKMKEYMSKGNSDIMDIGSVMILYSF